MTMGPHHGFHGVASDSHGSLKEMRETHSEQAEEAPRNANVNLIRNKEVLRGGCQMQGQNLNEFH